MLKLKRSHVAKGMELHRVVKHRGWVGTSHRLNLTRDTAMVAAEELESLRATKKAQEAVRDAAKANKREEKRGAEIAESRRLLLLQDERRARAANLPLAVFIQRKGSLHERRAAAAAAKLRKTCIETPARAVLPPNGSSHTAQRCENFSVSLI